MQREATCQKMVVLLLAFSLVCSCGVSKTQEGLLDAESGQTLAERQPCLVPGSWIKVDSPNGEGALSVSVAFDGIANQPPSVWVVGSDGNPYSRGAFTTDQYAGDSGSWIQRALVDSDGNNVPFEEVRAIGGDSSKMPTQEAAWGLLDNDHGQRLCFWYPNTGFVSQAAWDCGKGNPGAYDQGHGDDSNLGQWNFFDANSGFLQATDHDQGLNTKVAPPPLVVGVPGENWGDTIKGKPGLNIRRIIGDIAVVVASIAAGLVYAPAVGPIWGQGFQIVNAYTKQDLSELQGKVSTFTLGDPGLEESYVIDTDDNFWLIQLAPNSDNLGHAINFTANSSDGSSNPLYKIDAGIDGSLFGIGVNGTLYTLLGKQNLQNAINNGVDSGNSVLTALIQVPDFASPQLPTPGSPALFDVSVADKTHVWIVDNKFQLWTCCPNGVSNGKCLPKPAQ